MLSNKKTLALRLLILLFVAFGVFSCLKKPEYSVVPQIFPDFVMNKPTLNTLSGRVIEDSLFISIKYQDGDGDIGLTASDTLPPFGIFEGGISTNPRNPRYWNYHCQMQTKINGVFVDFILPGNQNLNGRISPLLEGMAKSPIEGTILYIPTAVPSDLFYDVISQTTRFNVETRFKIFIYDKALNKSNEIVTESVILNKGF